MRALRWLRRRWRALRHGAALDREHAAEQEFHVAMETDALVAEGAAPAEARRRALAAYGGRERYAEEARDARGWRPLHDAWDDLRYACRLVRRAPLFAAVATATLAVGIGGTTAMFSIVHGVLLRPLPYPDPAALVSVWDGGHSRAEFVGLRDRNRTLTAVAAYQPGFAVSVAGGGEPRKVTAALVSAGFFDLLGVTPAFGRVFRPGDDEPGRAPVIVLSDGLWREQFGGDPAVVGRTLQVDGVPRTVAGIAPPGFGFPGGETRAWIPLDLNPLQIGPYWGGYGHQLIGRLAPGMRAADVVADVRRIAAELRLENPAWRPGPEYLSGITVTDLRTRLVGDSRTLLVLLLAAVGVVLLIACANVANLLVVRGTARERELAVRAALGARRARLVRQLLAECGVLALIGGVAGLALAGGAIRVVLALLPAAIPRRGDIRVDGVVLLFAVVVTVGAGLLFGLLPALRLSQAHLGPALGGARAGIAPAQRRLAGLLVSAQTGLAVLLAIAAGLLVRSLSARLAVAPGFTVERVVATELAPPRQVYGDPEPQRLLAARLLERLAGMPELDAVALASQVPFDQTNHVMAMWVDGHTTNPNDLELFEIRRVTPDFFAVLDIPLRDGRLLGDEGDRPVAVISEGAARRYFRDRSPVGGRVRFPWPGWIEIIGVVGDARNNQLADSAAPTLYVPFAQGSAAEVFPSVAIVARSRGAAGPALAAIRTAVAHAAPDVPVGAQHTMTALIHRSVASPRSATLLLSAFGAIALLLGAIGTYGIVAYGVQRRRREIAVRMAVGARRGDVVRMVVREALQLALAGIVCGVAAALGLTRLMGSLLYGVGPVDPVVFAVAPLLLALTGVVAAVVPAVRAARVHPASALQAD